MRNKEMTMDDYRAMYAEYCLEAGHPTLMAAWAPCYSTKSFADFVAWRKRVEKYFDNNEDSS